MVQAIFFNSKRIIFCSKIGKKAKALITNNYSIVESPDNNFIAEQVKKIEKSKFDCLVFVVPDVKKYFIAFSALFTPIEAAGGLVYNTKKQTLFIYRNGVWDLPKGKIEKGEKTKTAACREIEEETGVKNITVEKKLCKTYHTYKVNSKHYLKTTHWYLGHIKKMQKTTPQLAEGITEIAWVDKKNIDQILANTYGAIQQVVALGY
jgi:ADP-ribose pyrophosphatase YjhB (NUDIX family)